MFGVFIFLIIFFSVIGIFYSVYKNSGKKFNLYGLILRDNGRISKVGIAFVLLMICLVYQVLFKEEISFHLVELLGIIFGAEVGVKYIATKEKCTVPENIEAKNKVSQDEIDKLFK